MSSLPMRSLDEEVINAYTHLVWAFLSLGFTLLFLIDGSIPVKFKTSSILITGLSGWTFLSSFLYHSSKGRKKSQNREIDKTSIFLMIMGCGLSINMSCVNVDAAIISCTILVLITAILTLVYTHLKEPPETFSITSYVLLGWLCIFPLTGAFGETLYETTSSTWLIIAGGGAYSAGILFYARDSIKWNHTIWHLFVMLGYVLHLIGHYRVVSYTSVT